MIEDIKKGLKALAGPKYEEIFALLSPFQDSEKLKEADLSDEEKGEFFYALGFLYEKKGLKIEKNIKECRRCYKEAIAYGSIKALLAYADLYDSYIISGLEELLFLKESFEKLDNEANLQDMDNKLKAKFYTEYGMTLYRLPDINISKANPLFEKSIEISQDGNKAYLYLARYYLMCMREDNKGKTNGNTSTFHTDSKKYHEYIYSAYKHGVELELNEEMEIGISLQTKRPYDAYLILRKFEDPKRIKNIFSISDEQRGIIFATLGYLLDPAHYKDNKDLPKDIEKAKEYYNKAISWCYEKRVEYNYLYNTLIEYTHCDGLSTKDKKCLAEYFLYFDNYKERYYGYYSAWGKLLIDLWNEGDSYYTVELTRNIGYVLEKAIAGAHSMRINVEPLFYLYIARFYASDKEEIDKETVITKVEKYFNLAIEKGDKKIKEAAQDELKVFMENNKKIV